MIQRNSFLLSCELVIYQYNFKIFISFPLLLWNNLSLSLSLSLYVNSLLFLLSVLSFLIFPVLYLFFIMFPLPAELTFSSWDSYDSVNTGLIIVPFQKSDCQLASGLKYHQYLIKWLSSSNTTQIGKGKRLKSWLQFMANPLVKMAGPHCCYCPLDQKYVTWNRTVMS